MYIFDILLSKINERAICDHIYMYLCPSLSDEIKRDISTFYFTWNLIRNKYIEQMINNEENNEFVSLSLSYIYMNIIQEILYVEKSSSIMLYKGEKWLLNTMKHMILKMSRVSRLKLMKRLNII